jgi:hypothetical protein
MVWIQQGLSDLLTNAGNMRYEDYLELNGILKLSLNKTEDFTMLLEVLKINKLHTSIECQLLTHKYSISRNSTILTPLPHLCANSMSNR